jgi:predicted NAD/FAD-binding protein
MFRELGVATEQSDMSFSVSVGGGAFEYRSRADGVFAQPSNLLRPRMWRMLADFRRLCREAPSLLAAEADEPLGRFLDRRGYSDAFRVDLLLPMVAAIWSSGLDDALDHPVGTLLRFLDNHGMLQVGRRPPWRTVTGGSREYVAAIARELPEIRSGTPVIAIERDGEGVILRDARGGADRFDHVVLATHADTALAIVGDDAAPSEHRLLSAFGFQDNLAVLHRDPAFMPRRRGAWASWNYLADGRDPQDRAKPVSLTYWMNRLQNLRTTEPVFVTLNPAREPRGATTAFTYAHPRYDLEAVRAQRELATIQGVRRTWYCGAWTGFGFHQDGLRSGLEVAAALGAPAPWWATAAAPDRDPAPLVGVPA